MDGSHYLITSSLLPRLLGLVYLIALLPFLFQIKGLIGKNGILPATDFLDTYRYYFRKNHILAIPTLFWINSSDKVLITVVWLGICCSLLLIFGFFPTLLLIFLYIIYLSIVHVGQEFLSFSWEAFLLEATINAILLSITVVPNEFVWISINLLLFRFYFEAGISKLQSKDPNWKNLTACAFHYETQPLPNAIAWYAQKLPMLFHKSACLMVFFIELILPFAIFLGNDARLLACIGFAFLQICIWLTGNFSYLNYMTLLLSTLLLCDPFLSLLQDTPQVIFPSPFIDTVLSTLGSVLIGLQLLQLYHRFTPCRWIANLFQSISSFHIANRYGIFAVMTTIRYEIIVEGSFDGYTWEEYLFSYKPSETSRRPRQIAPYQPRLDWQSWFLPFNDYRQQIWFQNLLQHLLKGTKEVTSLVRHNPFEEKPPRYVRAVVYHYTFSSCEEKKATAVWWNRKFICSYSPILEAYTSGKESK